MNPDDIVVLNGTQARQLLGELRETERKLDGLRKLHVAIEGSRVKFKVNEHMWSPPMGVPLSESKII